VLPVTDAVVLAARVDGVLLVASAGISTARALGRSLELLGRVDARVVGTVLNRAPDSAAYRYGYGYAYEAAPSPVPPPVNGNANAYFPANGQGVVSNGNGNGQGSGKRGQTGPAHARRETP
jgi:tyrosine-protein kinase